MEYVFYNEILQMTIFYCISLKVVSVSISLLLHAGENKIYLVIVYDRTCTFYAQFNLFFFQNKTMHHYFGKAKGKG